MHTECLEHVVSPLRRTGERLCVGRLLCNVRRTGVQGCRVEPFEGSEIFNFRETPEPYASSRSVRLASECSSPRRMQRRREESLWMGPEPSRRHICMPGGKAGDEAVVMALPHSTLGAPSTE